MGKYIQFTGSRAGVLAAVFLGIFAAPLSAKDLTNRVGFGFTYHQFNPSTGISMRFHPDRYFHGTGIVGVSSASSTHSIVVGGKLNRNLISEENALFYLGVGGFLLSNKTSTTSASGAEISALGGVEFFLPGLPNLGFQLEAGLAFRLYNGFQFQTVGGGFASAGMHYYL